MGGTKRHGAERRPRGPLEERHVSRLRRAARPRGHVEVPAGRGRHVEGGHLRRYAPAPGTRDILTNQTKYSRPAHIIQASRAQKKRDQCLVCAYVCVCAGGIRVGLSAGGQCFLGDLRWVLSLLFCVEGCLFGTWRGRCGVGGVRALFLTT